jgi:hypothetical protein
LKQLVGTSSLGVFLEQGRAMPPPVIPQKPRRRVPGRKL